MRLSLLLSETTISSKDTTLVISCTVLYAIIRVLINNLVLTRFTFLVPNKDQKVKFIHRSFDFLHYVISTILGFVALATRPYFQCWFNILHCVEYLGQTGDVFTCNVLEKMYFIYFFAYYLSDILWLHTNHDIIVLSFHHFFCISLVVLSVAICRPVYCFALMLLNNFPDPFLYLGKIGGYMKKPKVSDNSLIIFSILYFYFRIFVGSMIIYTLFAYNNVNKQTKNVPLYYVACTMICLLYCIHAFWGFEILSIAYRSLILKSVPISDENSNDS